MLRAVGSPIDVHEVDEALMRRAIEEVRAHGTRHGDAKREKRPALGTVVG